MSDEEKKEPADLRADEGSSEEREPEDQAEEEAAADGQPVRAARRTARRRQGPSDVVEEGEEDAAQDGPADDKKSPAVKPNYAFLGITAAVAAAVDLGSKEWAAKRLEEPGSKIVIIENWMHFDLATNKGGAWGLFGDQPDSIRLPFFFGISAFAVWFIVRMFKQLEPRQKALKWALPLVLGGALGNLVDRVRHQHVIDFIDCFATIDGQVKHWPTFNVADIWIVAGVILMLIDGLTPKPRKIIKRVRVQRKDDVAKVEEDAEKASA